MLEVHCDRMAGSTGSLYYSTPAAAAFTGYQGVVLDLVEAAECIVRMVRLEAERPRDEHALTAFTWQALLLYVRCFDPGMDGRDTVLDAGARAAYTAEEQLLHENLRVTRNKRYAYVGKQAQHQCIVALYDSGTEPRLQPHAEIERATWMHDSAQLALFASMVGKALEFAQRELVSAETALRTELANEPIAVGIVATIQKKRSHVNPEAAVVKLMLGL